MASDQDHEPQTELEDLEVSEEEADDVRGGRAGEPPPDGPVPVPYPN